MDKRNNQTEGEEQGGRLPDVKKEKPFKQDALRDISEIDQQEGMMNNGNLGGNFGENSTAESDANS